MNFKQSIVGSITAFLIATSCCWLPAIIVALGGASSWLAFSKGLEQFSIVFAILGLGFLLYGGYQIYKRKIGKNDSREVELLSKITCPNCGFEKDEIMPTNACQYFYECEKCLSVLKPIKGDCCVYCSYGSTKCPPIQLNQNCC